MNRIGLLNLCALLLFTHACSEEADDLAFVEEGGTARDAAIAELKRAQTRLLAQFDSGARLWANGTDAGFFPERLATRELVREATDQMIGYALGSFPVELIAGTGYVRVGSYKMRVEKTAWSYWDPRDPDSDSINIFRLASSGNTCGIAGDGCAPGGGGCCNGYSCEPLSINSNTWACK